MKGSVSPFSGKYFYVICRKTDGKLLLEDAKLPFYWSKSVAKDRCKHFPGMAVHRIKFEDINDLILQSVKV